MSTRKRARVPSAPPSLTRAKVRFWTRLGRRDARKYGGLLDFTKTHALIKAINECQQGQHEVNEWLVREIEPERTGNLRIEVKSQLDRENLKSLKSSRTTSQRERARIDAAIARLELQMANAEAQKQANIVKGNSKFLIAHELMGTWEKHYGQMAAVYTRARAMQRNEDVSSVEAEIPVMDSVPVIEIDGFDGSNRSKRGDAK